MTYVTLASTRDAFIFHMDYQLSLFSQQNSIEVATFSHTSYIKVLDLIDMNPIEVLFFDLDDENHESLLISVKQKFKDILCIGMGKSKTADEQSRLFGLGMDDYITLPASLELFNIRMKRILRLTQKNSKNNKRDHKKMEPEELPFDSEEIEEIEDTLKELQLQILLMGKTDLCSDDVYNITRLLGRVQSTFMYMVATYPLATSMHELCEEIETNVDSFILHSQELNLIALSFVKDLIQWKNSIFYGRGQKVDFLNDSIMANVKTFISFLDTSDKSQEEDLDTIFNF